MTPQEALAQALRGPHDDLARGELTRMRPDDAMEYAAAILDALPEGWALLNAEGAVMHTKATLAKGAQQERERLWEVVKPLMDMLPPGYGRDPRFAAMWDAFHPDEADR